MNRYETEESWHNAQARKVARWDAAQAVADATARAVTKSPVLFMKGNPRLPGEDLISYGLRLKEVVL